MKSCSYFALFSPDSKLKNHKEMYSSIFIENFNYQRQDILLLGLVCILQAKHTAQVRLVFFTAFLSFFRIIRRPLTSTSQSNYLVLPLTSGTIYQDQAFL